MKTDNGFILVAVLWISLLLSVFALNLSTKSRLQAIQALNVEGALFNNEALYSGLDKGFHEYLKYKENKALLEKKEESESLSGQNLDLWYPGYEPYTMEVQDVRVAVKIINSRGKFNINRADIHLLQKIIPICGVPPGTETTSIANSILDWIDRDDLKRPEGAERDYYQSLDFPYLPKNNTVEEPAELLLVKGVTRDLYYGTEEHPGLIHFFSVYGGEEKLDINSADPAAFSVLEGLPGEIVEDIVEKRKQERIDNLSQLSKIVPHGYFEQLADHFYVADEKEMVIEAAILLEDGRPGKTMTRRIGE